MSDADPDNVGDGSPQGSGGGIQELRNHLKKLEKDLRARDDQLTEMSTKLAERESTIAGFARSQMFDKLGIPEKGAGKLFRQHYEGDLTEEAVLQAAAEYDLVQPSAPTTPVDQGAFQRMDQVLAGSSATPPSGALAALQAAKNIDELTETIERLGLTERYR